MRTLRGLGIAAWLLAAGPALATGLPPLPVWSPSDYEKLEKGEITPGQDFFGKQGDEGEGPSPPPQDSLPEPPAEESEAVELPTEISSGMVDAYLDTVPRPTEEGTEFLIDPQELLAQQDFRDRASFLKYHAGESSIDMFVYLFDARQELPDRLTLQAIYDKHFNGGESRALIFYHLGMPERSQLLLSSDVRAAVSEDEQRRALRAAVQEAFEKSDAAYQLDNFLVELSIRLYWVEREMAGFRQSPAETGSPSRGRESAPASPHQRDQAWSLISRMIILAAILVFGTLLGWLVATLAERRIRYVFPEVESGPLLGAPHAAGVGAVVSFSNAHLPPSQQRDHVPDYLQRM